MSSKVFSSWTSENSYNIVLTNKKLCHFPSILNGMSYFERKRKVKCVRTSDALVEALGKAFNFKKKMKK